ncbi:MAG: hypothetical protein ABI461_09690 [Polyangiaceae bacterium]
MRDRRTPRSLSSRLVAFGVIAFGVAGACTTFNGLSVPGAVSGDASFDASIDGEAGPSPLDGGVGFLSLEDAVRFCVNAFNCPNLAMSTIESVDVPVDTQHFSSCVDWLAGGLPPDRLGVDQTASFLECAAKATSCAAATDCMWLDLIDTSDPRCNGIDSGPATEAGIDPGTCQDDGGTIIYCTSSPYIVRCENAYWAEGSTCRKGSDGVHRCDLKTPCGSTTDCNGSILSYCGVNGDRVGYDCAVGGFTCGTDISGDTDCLTNGSLRSCSIIGATCSGDTVNVCDGEYTAAYDCVALNATCDDTFTARCKRPTDTCSPGSPGIDTCTGDTISLCSGGQPKTFDCTSIGMKCKPAASGQSAHCG